jgi:hypothetical protein
MSAADRPFADGGSLWAIAAYFNPLGSRRRLANYRVFRERLGVPLLTVELGYGAGFELGAGDADRLIQLRGGDILWQKERLLNLALAALPDDCSIVVWVDADVIFASGDWPERVRGLLSVSPIVHAYSRVHSMGPDWTGGRPDAVHVEKTWTGVVSAITSGLGSEGWAVGLPDANRPKFGIGHAWAARRDLLARHGFYDACIVGGADRALVCAAYGFLAELMDMQHMNERQRRRYLEWARPFHSDVDGAVSCLDEDIFHLWHGDTASRRYIGRHADLERFDFDPYGDIRQVANGGWEWNSDKPDLHRHVRDYFALRDAAEWALAG